MLYFCNPTKIVHWLLQKRALRACSADAELKSQFSPLPQIDSQLFFEFTHASCKQDGGETAQTPKKGIQSVCVIVSHKLDFNNDNYGSVHILILL